MGLEPKPALDSTLGAAFVSVITSAALFGMLTTQCYCYFVRFKHDPRWIKCIVIGLWIIDFAHQVSASIMMFQYSLGHFGDFKHLKRITWTAGLCVMLEPFPAFVVQMYFTRRSYYLNPKLWPMTAFTVVLSVLTLGVGEACGINTLLINHFAELKGYTWLVTLWLVTSCVCDISVTLPVVWTLYTSRTGFKDTDVLLAKLIIWTVNTGALPASFALFEAIMFITKNDTLIHLAANIVLAKLYSNTLVASLNRRCHPIERAPDPLHCSHDIATFSPDSQCNPIQEAPRNREARIYPSFDKHLDPQNDAHEQIQISVTTHHYWEREPK